MKQGIVCAQADTQSASSSKRTSVMKEVSGEVTWAGKDKIAVMYGVDESQTGENEILLPISATTRIVHKQSLRDFSRGDTVSIQYEELTIEDASGSKTTRTAKVITFLKPAMIEVPMADDEKAAAAVESQQQTTVLGSY
jgi:hypothetical protein